MADNESFEALEVQNPKLGQEELEEEEDDDDEEEEEGEEEEEEEEEEQFSELQSSVTPPVGAEFMESQSEIVAVTSSIPLSVTDQHADFATSSSRQLLTGMEVNCASQTIDSGEFKEQVGAFPQEVLADVTVQAAKPQTENQLRWSQDPTYSSELSPTSVTQSTLSAANPTMFERRLSPIPKGNNGCVPETDHQISSDLKAISAVPIVKAPSADGYNWRKYGQKQVKSTKGSRSYYKCTYSNCCSKKIECSDHSGSVIEIIYKGPHIHEPPRKVNSPKESRLAASAGSDVGSSLIPHPIKTLNDPSASSREHVQEVSPLPEPKRQKSRDSEENVKVKVKVKDEQLVEPEPKQRLKKSGPPGPCPVLKPGKKPKLVVHAAGDVGISSDGYRWRKYGQKMVKGNPHPRNYYRCTSAGCPVRKHIERAIENTSALIITYKGVHDHDMPVPKKRHGPPSAHLVAAAAPASMSNLQLKSCDALQNQISSTQWSLGTEGELTGETLDLGGEKAMESARTLLSIGFEIKPC